MAFRYQSYFVPIHVHIAVDEQWKIQPIFLNITQIPANRRRIFLQKYKDTFKWKGSEDILEIGCADGSITKEVLYPFIEKHLNSLLAVDISASALDVARARNNNPKISFEQMDIGNESEGDKYQDKFDKIFAFYCFHLVKPSEAWSKNVYKMLKRGGQIFGTIVQSPNFISLAMDDQLADTDAPWNPHIQNRPSVLTFYGPKPLEAVTKIITDAGLIVNDIFIEAVPSTYENKENLKKTIVSYSFFMKYVPSEMKDVYMEDFIRRIFERIGVDDNGYYHYALDVISFVATKP